MQSHKLQNNYLQHHLIRKSQTNIRAIRELACKELKRVLPTRCCTGRKKCAAVSRYIYFDLGAWESDHKLSWVRREDKRKIQRANLQQSLVREQKESS